jgi:hypothetical protein
MNILSKILLEGYDIKLESASWIDVIDGMSQDAKDMFYLKLEIKRHGGDDLCLGAISPQKLRGEDGDKLILETLEEMAGIIKKDER